MKANMERKVLIEIVIKIQKQVIGARLVGI